MTTSGTYQFNPALGEIVLYAYQNIGIRPTAVLQEHMESARMATNMMLSRWSNQGVNLWAVDLITTPLVAGQATYDVDPSTVMILDAYTTAGGPDRVIMPISRTEYASYPNKAQQGFPTSFWFDRLTSPTVTLGRSRMAPARRRSSTTGCGAFRMPACRTGSRSKSRTFGWRPSRMGSPTDWRASGRRRWPWGSRRRPTRAIRSPPSRTSRTCRPTSHP